MASLGARAPLTAAATAARPVAGGPASTTTAPPAPALSSALPTPSPSFVVPPTAPSSSSSSSGLPSVENPGTEYILYYQGTSGQELMERINRLPLLRSRMTYQDITPLLNLEWFRRRSILRVPALYECKSNQSYGVAALTQIILEHEQKDLVQQDASGATAAAASRNRTLLASQTAKQIPFTMAQDILAALEEIRVRLGTLQMDMAVIKSQMTPQSKFVRSALARSLREGGGAAGGSPPSSPPSVDHSRGGGGVGAGGRSIPVVAVSSGGGGHGKMLQPLMTTTKGADSLKVDLKHYEAQRASQDRGYQLAARSRGGAAAAASIDDDEEDEDHDDERYAEGGDREPSMIRRDFKTPAVGKAAASSAPSSATAAAAAVPPPGRYAGRSSGGASGVSFGDDGSGPFARSGPPPPLGGRSAPSEWTWTR